MAERPKYFRQLGTGRIYAYCEHLAKRKDMVPIVEVEPVVRIVPTDPLPDVTPVIGEPDPAVQVEKKGTTKKKAE